MPNNESRRPARMVVAAMAVVVCAFTATLVFSELALEPIERRSDAIAANALPSIRLLSVARNTLENVEDVIQATYLHSPSGAERSPQVTPDALDAVRGEFEAELGEYASLPQFPGEGNVAAQVYEAVAVLDDHLAAFLERVRTDPALAARSAAFFQLLPYIDRTDDALYRLQIFNLDRAQTQAEALVATKNKARMVGLSLFGVSLGAAVVASVLVVRLLRIREREVLLNEKLLSVRATELESFAGRVAHELKNPLGAISLRLSVLQSKVQSPPQVITDSLRKALRQVSHMDTIIDGLLEFARGGTEPPTGAHAELRPILDNVVAELEPAATTAHAEVIVHPFAPQEVACTPAALRSVLNNLVGNAVEHSEEGTRTERKVSVRVKDKVNAVRIEVQDSGPGLPPGLAQRAFEPFVRLGATQRSATGIALATVRRIVEACGGRVGVRSLLHEGTCFWFEVPKPVARASP